MSVDSCSCSQRAQLEGIVSLWLRWPKFAEKLLFKKLVKKAAHKFTRHCKAVNVLPQQSLFSPTELEIYCLTIFLSLSHQKNMKITVTLKTNSMISIHSLLIRFASVAEKTGNSSKILRDLWELEPAHEPESEEPSFFPSTFPSISPLVLLLRSVLVLLLLPVLVCQPANYPAKSATVGVAVPNPNPNWRVEVVALLRVVTSMGCLCRLSPCRNFDVHLVNPLVSCLNNTQFVCACHTRARGSSIMLVIFVFVCIEH